MIHVPDRLLLILVLLAVMAVSTSCNRMDSTKGADDSAHSEHEHFPAHWPVTIFAASERLTALGGDRGQLDSKEGVSFEREFIDLIRWLPELTADSDLKEPDFNRIDLWSSKYAPLFESMLGEGGTMEAMLAVDGLDFAIKELQKIVQAESERLAAIQGQ